MPCSKQNGEGEKEGGRCGVGWNRLGNRKTRVGIHTLKSCVTSFKSLSLGLLFLFCRIKTTLAWKNIMEIRGQELAQVYYSDDDNCYYDDATYRMMPVGNQEHHLQRCMF